VRIARNAARAEERAGQIDIDDRAPGIHRQVVDRYRRRAAPGIVEQQVQAAKPVGGFPEQVVDRLHIRNVGRDHQRLPGFRQAGGLLQLRHAAAGQGDRVTRIEQAQRHRLADARSRTRYNRDLPHVVFPVLVPLSWRPNDLR
jgi:hypothetical protein